MTPVAPPSSSHFLFYPLPISHVCTHAFTTTLCLPLKPILHQSSIHLSPIFHIMLPIYLATHDCPSTYLLPIYQTSHPSTIYTSIHLPIIQPFIHPPTHHPSIHLSIYTSIQALVCHPTICSPLDETYDLLPFMSRISEWVTCSFTIMEPLVC